MVANCIITMIGGQETTTNLIASGLLTLLKNPGELEHCGTSGFVAFRCQRNYFVSRVRVNIPPALRLRILSWAESASPRAKPVIAVMAAGNRDPERFPGPNRLDLSRKDNRHLAFGWAAHFCFGAPLARLEGQIALRRLITLSNLQLASESHTWRTNSGLRGLTELPVTFDSSLQ